MESALFVIGLATYLYLFFTLLEFIVGFNKIKNLSTQQPIKEREKLPSLSIVLSALNEEREIANALLTLLNLDYPNLEIIAINDRSTDKTPDILDQMQTQYPRLKVLHITELPSGWFGKNHALHVGAQHAKGEWILFTDADVTMRRDTLIKSISYVLEKKLDHLAIFEKHLGRYFWLKVSFLGLYISYSMMQKPWRIRYAWSKKSIGHGAFNLVNKKVYQQCGGHSAIAMECLDDMKLGALIKSNGYYQDTVDGRDFVEREWYSSLHEMINGLKKNSFAYLNYQVLPAILSSILLLLFFIWPFFAIMLFDGCLYSINLLNIGLTLLIGLYVAKQYRLPKCYALLYPISICILLYTILNSVFSVCWNKGVIWRGTYYPLHIIKSKKG